MNIGALLGLLIFEMPVPGYFGFPAFAFECFTMYVTLRALTTWAVPAASRHLSRPVALSWPPSASTVTVDVRSPRARNQAAIRQR
jgi:hypothetical protein